MTEEFLVTKPDRSPAPDAPKTELDEVRDLILRYPGVARAQLERTAGGRLTARVQGWDHANDLSPTGPLSELAEINPHETRFLYDEIFSAESYLQGGITLREDAVVFDVGANIGMFSLFVGARCPSADVFAFEPVPDVFDVLRSNVERHGVAARLLPSGCPTGTRTSSSTSTRASRSCRAAATTRTWTTRST